jgi:hypothetical protein
VNACTPRARLGHARAAGSGDSAIRTQPRLDATSLARTTLSSPTRPFGTELAAPAGGPWACRMAPCWIIGGGRRRSTLPDRLRLLIPDLRAHRESTASFDFEAAVQDMFAPAR